VIEDCELALALDPSYSKALARLAVAHAALKQYNSAEGITIQTPYLLALYLEFIYCRFVFIYLVSHLAEAIEAYTELLTIQPSPSVRDSLKQVERLRDEAVAAEKSAASGKRKVVEVPSPAETAQLAEKSVGANGNQVVKDEVSAGTIKFSACYQPRVRA